MGLWKYCVLFWCPSIRVNFPCGIYITDGHKHYIRMMLPIRTQRAVQRSHSTVQLYYILDSSPSSLLIRVRVLGLKLNLLFFHRVLWTGVTLLSHSNTTLQSIQRSVCLIAKPLNKGHLWDIEVVCLFRGFPCSEVSWVGWYTGNIYTRGALVYTARGW